MDNTTLVIDALTKQFKETIAVNNISVNFEKGEMVGIIGRSGAGKSTFLRLINRLIDPTGGKIFYMNQNISRLKGVALRDWRAKCAMIFQQFNLVGRMDVMSNVMVGRLRYHRTIPTLLKRFPRNDKVMAIKALDRLGMAKYALQRVDTLSGGQQQRVAITKALMQSPHILLADEPIASLDPRNAAIVMGALKRINQEDGITVLCNLHHLNTAKKYCDRILGMQSGAIVFDDSPLKLTLEKVGEIYGMEGMNELNETNQLDEQKTGTIAA